MLKKKIGTTNNELARMIEDLAGMTARGFEQTATKAELNNLEERLGGRIDGLDGSVDALDGRIDGLEKRMAAEFQDMKHILKPLQRDVQDHSAELTEIRGRLDRVEKKIGIRK